MEAVPGISAANAAAARIELCRIGDVSATIAVQPAAGTEQTALVTLTNTGTASCSISGWPTIALVNAANRPVEVPTVKVDEPGPATEFTLAGGDAAYAGIKWAGCAKGDEGCAAGNTLRYDLGLSTAGPVATLEGFPKGKRNNITMRSLEIGSLQPTRQGVTDW
ncbi:DUF4232 domain-containing protein [Actinoplanes sp. NPDC024001]|uniref:DUF4232 domain-containing protein n=1 Tax=Actinoplanes sp. NPDC024001 TaxID=3154598 RepID=UPI0033D60688